MTSGCLICRKVWKTFEDSPIRRRISPLLQSEHNATEYTYFQEDPPTRSMLSIKLNALSPNGDAHGIFFKIISTQGLTT